MDPFQIETVAEEKVHLAHELGHCETGSFYNIYSSLDIREKQERRADGWAVLKLMPFCDFKNALSLGFTEIWELAEYFEVTEEFVLKAIKYYREKNFLRLN